MPNLTLWKLDGSPPANAVHTLADMLGLELELKAVDFANMEHKSPDYLKMNPLGTIPVLKDGDFVLVDSHAMMKYLLSRYGSDKIGKLYPSDVETRALVDQSLFMDTGVLFIKVKIVALPTVFEGLKGPTDRHIKEIQDACGAVEAFLGDKEYIAADHLTIADISVGSTVAALNAIHKLDKAQFPRTCAWLDRLTAIPEFDRHANKGAKILGKFLHSYWDKSK